jgi:hypothetical protein
LGPGLFILGLDNHVGFVFYDGKKVLFVHSTYLGEQEVMAEELESSLPVLTSEYRIIGKILSDRQMVMWLKGVRLTLF